MKTAVYILLLFFLSASPVIAQKFPYPTAIKYPYGFIPKGLTVDKVKAEYARWKKAILVDCSSKGIGIQGDNDIRVEGIGFGMLLTAYMGDKTEFDGILKFYESNCSANAGGMMTWQVSCSGSVGSGSATDGDIDVAFGLIIGSWQWPDGGYLDKAKKVIENLKKVVVSCSGVSALAGGYSGSPWGGCSQTDISYYNPAAFREFAKVTKDTMWNKLADDTYTILNNSANATTGLVPDWQTVSGSAGAGREATYKYDACRAPWRIALDYLWNGNEKAHTWCKKLSDWAYGIGPKNIKDGYALSGTANGSTHNMCFTGGFACAAMCNSQEIADAFATEVSAIAARDNSWFTFSVGCCNMITLVGNQWRNDLVGIRRGANRITQIKTASFSTRLTPTTLEISNSNKNSCIQITTLSGQRIARYNLSAGRCSIPREAIGNGCIVVQWYNENGSCSASKIVALNR